MRITNWEEPARRRLRHYQFSASQILIYFVNKEYDLYMKIIVIILYKKIRFLYFFLYLLYIHYSSNCIENMIWCATTRNDELFSITSITNDIIIKNLQISRNVISVVVFIKIICMKKKLILTHIIFCLMFLKSTGIIGKKSWTKMMANRNIINRIYHFWQMTRWKKKWKDKFVISI